MNYLESRFGEHFLDDIKIWIAENFDIYELYTKQEIRDWLKENAEDFGYIEEE